MDKRGAQAIVSQGKGIKKRQCRPLFRRIEKRYGVPAGPLIAIWGMETGFGAYMGNQNTLSAVATLAYDCRRSAFFTDQLQAALKLVQRGVHLRLVHRRHAWRNRPDPVPAPERAALWRGWRWRRPRRHGRLQGRCARLHRQFPARSWLVSAARGYQPGEANYGAIQGWNAASVYQQAIAKMAQQIDGQ